MQPNQATSPNTRRIALVVAAVIATVAVILAVIFITTRPNQDDLKASKTQVSDAVEARRELAPAVNEYLAAFKAAYNKSKSADKAKEAAKPEYAAFKKAAAKASASAKVLTDNRASNDSDVGTSIRQFTEDYDAEVAYYTGLVDVYADYTILFAQDADRCAGIFVGQSDGLADRKRQLDAAAKQCYSALNELKQSSSSAYAEYAKKVERRVKRMQSDAAATVEAEKKLKEYQERATDYQRQYDAAKKRNAPATEIQALADELKEFNAEISQNRANFDYAAKSYLDTVKEMPSLYADVYGKDVPAKLKYYSQLIDFRSKVLEHVIDSHVTTT